MITDKDIQDMVKYIENVLNEKPKLYPNWLEMYLNICKQSKNKILTAKQKEVLVIAYNKLFDRFENGIT